MGKLIDPHGMRVERPRRVIVMVEDENGRMHGWEVTNPGPAGFRLGHPGGNAHATMTASGEFRRMSKTAQSMAIEDAMRERVEQMPTGRAGDEVVELDGFGRPQLAYVIDVEVIDDEPADQ